MHTEVLAMLLDPRFRDMKGVPLGEHEECWALLEKYLTALIQEQQEEAQRAAAGAAGGGAPAQVQGVQQLQPDDPAYDSSEEAKRPQKEKEEDVKPWRRQGVTAGDAAAACVKAYRSWRGGGVIGIDRDPLRGCWMRHAEEDTFGQMADLARVVLAAPATSAPVERVFSEASLIMTKTRMTMDPENLGLLLFLHNVWDLAREMNLLRI